MTAEEFTTAAADVGRRLRDRCNARTFYNLPDRDLIAYYTMAAPLRLQELRFRTSHPWCFMGQIVYVQSYSPVIVYVEDCEDLLHPVAFATQCGGAGIPVQLIVPGNTVTVMGAYQHEFPGNRRGVRVDDIRKATNFPMMMGDHLDLSDRIPDFEAARRPVEKTCRKCNRKRPGMRPCVQCNMVWYCDIECLVDHWYTRHGNECPVLRGKRLQTLLERNWPVRAQTQ